LFERSNKSVRLTAVGQEILLIAHRVQEGAADIRRTAMAHSDPLAGKIKMGIIPTIAPMIIPSLLAMTGRKFPALHLSFVEDMTDPLEDMLRSGALDAAILATDPMHSTLVDIPLYDEPFWAAFPKGHRLEQKSELVAVDIDPQELLLLSEGHCFRDQALSVCRHAVSQNAAQADTRATSMETILNLVAAGAGITLIPALATQGGRLAETGVIARPFAKSPRGVAPGAAGVSAHKPPLATYAGLVRGDHRRRVAPCVCGAKRRIDLFRTFLSKANSRLSHCGKVSNFKA
jgi:LysR family transcriptional regulator, hydrogen peroxide-inducible genes activator